MASSKGSYCVPLWVLHCLAVGGGAGVENTGGWFDTAAAREDVVAETLKRGVDAN